MNVDIVILEVMVALLLLVPEDIGAVRVAAEGLPPLDCGHEERSWRNSCYRYQLQPQTDSSNASKYCRRAHGELVSISSTSEQVFVEELIRSVTTTSGSELPYKVWIGLVVGGNTIRWRNGDPLNFTHWAAPPDTTSSKVLNAAMEPHDRYRWKVVKSRWNYPFVCKRGPESGALVINATQSHTQPEMGVTMILECAVLQGHPRPGPPRWYINGTYSGSYGQHRLEQSSPDEYIFGNFTCLVNTTYQGVDYTFMIEPPGDPSYFHVEIERAVVSPGEDISLYCTSEGYPRPQVDWLHDGQDIQEDNINIVTNFRPGEPDVTSEVFVNGSKPSNAGVYTCHATTTLGFKQSLKSLVYLTGDPWYATISPTFSMVSIGEKLLLNCSSAGFPHPKLEWLHNGQVPRAQNAFITNVNEDEPYSTALLTIYKFKMNNAGTYTCNIRTELGYNSTLTAQVVHVELSESLAAEERELIEKWMQDLDPIPAEMVDIISNSTHGYLSLLVDLVMAASRNHANGDISTQITQVVRKELATTNHFFNMSDSKGEQDVKNLLTISDAVLSDDSSDLSEEVGHHDVALGLDHVLSRSASTLSAGSQVNLNTTHSEVWMRGEAGSMFSGLEYMSGAVQVTAGAHMVASDPDITTTSVVAIFKAYREMTVTSEGEQTGTDSPLVSVSVLTGGAPVSIPVCWSVNTYTQVNAENGTHQTKHVCSFMKGGQRSLNDTQTDEIRWSSEGCHMISNTNYSVQCCCNHTTNYGILMSVTPITIEDHHALSLTIITYVGCSISIICCLLTLLVFRILRLGRRLTMIHMNLCCSLVLLQITFLAGAGATYNLVACAIVTVLLHLATLSVFCWMFVESLHLYRKIFHVFASDWSIWVYCSIGYGPPIIFVAISAGVKSNLYISADRISCWLPHEDGIIWSFIGPAILIILINLIVVIMVLWTSITRLKQNSNSALYITIRAAARNMLFLLPITGLAWVVGLFAVNEETLVFQYIFAILNSLQGLFLFLCHCVFDKEVQTAFIKWRRTRAPSIFSRSTEMTTVSNTDRKGSQPPQDQTRKKSSAPALLGYTKK